MRKLKSKKGFTLIELLAVVIILGILMTVGGLAVTRITEGTRKNTFVNTAQEYAEAVRTLWTSDAIYCGNNNFISSDVADGDYYILIDSKDPKFNYLLEKNNKSSWGNRDLKGYVRVNVSTNAKGKRDVKYYISITDGIHAITDDKEADKLKKGDLEMDISKDKEKLESINKTPFDIGSLTTCGEPGMGNDKEIIVNMVKGNIKNPKIGDMFSIKNERFYIYSWTDTTVTAIAEYNLYVGGTYNGYIELYGPEATGLQSSEMVFKNGKAHGITAGRGREVTESLNNYKIILENYGAKLNDIRLITKEELDNVFSFPKADGTFSSIYPWIYSTSYWTASAQNATSNNIWTVSNIKDDKNNIIGNLGRCVHYSKGYYGIRPVITINKSEF